MKARPSRWPPDSAIALPPGCRGGGPAVTSAKPSPRPADGRQRARRPQRPRHRHPARPARLPFYAFAGAFAALLVSFLGLGLLWSRSRLTGEAAGRPLPAAVQRCADARATTLALRALGLAAYLTLLAHLLLGPDDPARNPAPAAVYALFWAGLVPLSLLCGPLWRRLNPLRTLHLLGRALLRRPEPDRVPPAPLGLWPAALGLAALTWLELASPAPASRAALLTFLGAYTVLQLAAAARWGEAWFARGDAFEAYAGLLARLSPFGRRADGRLVVRNPLDGLDATERVPGLAATLCVLLGSTAYDGLSGTAGGPAPSRPRRWGAPRPPPSASSR